jgi:hemin uptake protein HemP
VNSPNDQTSPEAGSESTADPSPLLPKIIKFDDLARCGDEIWIEHESQLYRLRRTRQGKLILTK